MKLSSNFTTERTFTGYHHISEMTMAFRVDCATNYYGPECTLHCEESPGVWLCDENGKMCLRNGYDPVENCSQCLPNRNLYFNCSSCVPGFVGDNCSASECVFLYTLSSSVLQDYILWVIIIQELSHLHVHRN